MIHRKRFSEKLPTALFVMSVAVLNPSCSGSTPDSTGSGGALSAGGNSSIGGDNSMGGAVTGGSKAVGGVPAATGGASVATGGQIATGGALNATGGVGVATGGANATGGQLATGGTLSAMGGTVAATGGTKETGGQLATGGTVSATGGATVAAGGKATGGAPPATGGSKATGGAPPATGGSNATGGAAATGGTNNGSVSYPYVFSCFNDSATVSSLDIYTSTDALNFTLLLDTGFTGPTNNLRDPSIMKHSDGNYYVAFTTPPSGTGCCGPETSFSIARSANLRNWTTIATVPCGVPNTTNVWAPEWYKDSDGSIHILVSVDQKTYRYEPTDNTLTKWGAGTWIGIGPGYIDTFIVKIGATYHAFPKKESTLFIEHATSAGIDGPWAFVGTGNWAGWGTHREAPALIQLPNGNWRLYCDGGSAGHEMYSDSTDTFQTWSALKTLPAVGNNISHGTVIKGN